MTKYEEYMQIIEDLLEDGQDTETLDALEAAQDSLGFMQGLHDTFKMQGAVLGDVPEPSVLENLIDAYYGELAAAVLFLSDVNVKDSPKLLRVIAKNLEKEKSEHVPTVVVKGFERLATRIENTRANQVAIAEAMRKK